MGDKSNRGGLTEEAAKQLGVKARASTFKEKVWVNPSRTLYITNIAPGTSTEELEALFKDLEGFIALRRVRSMCFVDFDQKQHATAAMWKTNGHRFKPHHAGLLVSYDKDDDEEKGGWSMRKREEEKQRKAVAEASRVTYRCAACNHFCLKLARPVAEMPERRTDASRVVNCAADLVTLCCVKGATKLLKREKGVEKQFRYNCELCDAVVAYRSVPFDQETKFIYVLPQAVFDPRCPRPQTMADGVLRPQAMGEGVLRPQTMAEGVLRPQAMAGSGGRDEKGGQGTGVGEGGEGKESVASATGELQEGQKSDKEQDKGQVGIGEEENKVGKEKEGGEQLRGKAGGTNEQQRTN